MTQPLAQQVLRTDIAGMPLEWVDYQTAVRLYHFGHVAYTCGTPLYAVRGGTNAASGERSVIEVNSIIATTGDQSALRHSRETYSPPLNNQALFKRDAHV